MASSSVPLDERKMKREIAAARVSSSHIRVYRAYMRSLVRSLQGSLACRKCDRYKHDAEACDSEGARTSLNVPVDASSMKL